MTRTVLDELIDRGIVNQHEQNGKTVHAVTDEPAVREILASESVSIYIGFDPTATSLHVGHLLPIMTLAHFQRAGHTPIVVVGGATGMIGDPSGRSTERPLLSPEQVDANAVSVRQQLEKFLSFEGDNAAVMLNNYDWIGSKSFLQWLREVGKYFSVNYMVSKESVRKRLQERDQGISYTEFSYMLLQAYDFYHLFTKYGCRLQGGGSDQWGNITAGTDFIRRKTGQEAYGITYPLLASATGDKFGKSAGNAVWLDPEMTPPYGFYQFWLNTGDRDIERYLKFFTFLNLDEIRTICAEHQVAPEKRVAQKALATEVTRVVHGEEGVETALRATQVLFGSSLEGLRDRDLNEIFRDVPSTNMPRDKLQSGVPLLDLLIETGVCSSKGQGRRLVKGGGLSINNQRVEDTELIVTTDHLASESLLVLRSGKKRYHLVRFSAEQPEPRE